MEVRRRGRTFVGILALGFVASVCAAGTIGETVAGWVMFVAIAVAVASLFGRLE